MNSRQIIARVMKSGEVKYSTVIVNTFFFLRKKHSAILRLFLLGIMFAVLR